MYRSVRRSALCSRRMAKVELTKHLFQFFPHLEGKELVVEAATVADVVRGLDAIAPGIAFYVCDERGRLRQHVNVFIGEDAVIDRRECRCESFLPASSLPPDR